MKFMKIGTKPDTFYTQDASRILITDTPNDLVVRINNTTYHLHRSSLVPKCGLLPRLFTDSEESDSVTIELNDIPGGSDAFELCAKFCYGITINLSAHNLVNVLCASTFLRMSDSSGFSVKENEAALERHRRVVNTVVNMIPADKGSVSEGFLLRLVSIASYVGASLTTKTELIRKAGLQLDEATLDDLLLRSHSSSHHRRYDTDLVATVLESFLMLWRRQSSAHLSSNNSQLVHSIRKVAKLIDSYLQAVAQDVHMSVSKFVSLAETVPDIARESHDRLYKAINIYLKVHPEISKEEKKQLCRSLDCQKLSAEVRAHAVKNERMPLRTVVQALFFDQESSSKGASSRLESQELFSRGKETSTDMHKLHLGQAETASIGKAKNILEGAKRGEEKIRSSTDPKKIVRKETRSEHKHHISRDR
ncbi:PREDICTED: BTB/POZ domain-containing protein At5g47800-like [Camelina sativa]|uniref:BTB/POZ domain-containing protein At5g47800-like n=1 Tax=Camelina sativa TaxID=90675 RepID=A0ABM1REU1_CAMSA|nr:PREDICTED: BTB/POZ domain-containing protein At5g47800-like [Camelina sativa]